MTDPENITVTFSVTMNQYFAHSLAQFVKRVDWGDVAKCTGDAQETHEAIEALELIRAALRDAGYPTRT